MYQEDVVLCGSSAYTQKFYLADDFDRLPSAIKDELKAMCVLYTEDVGGVLTLEFDPEGNLNFKVTHEDNDFFFDEIGSYLKIKQLRYTKRELLESLEMYFKVFFLGEEPENGKD
ncbi:MAG: hypothetical protein ILP10_00575 [Lachnospiraceae bacterium]|nr:hypothetical protein [Lachnospiraceae bacterium]